MRRSIKFAPREPRYYRAVPVVVLIIGAITLAGCDNGTTSHKNTPSYKNGYSAGLKLPSYSGAAADQLCQNVLEGAVLNPLPGEDLTYAKEGCIAAVTGK